MASASRTSPKRTKATRSGVLADRAAAKRKNHEASRAFSRRLTQLAQGSSRSRPLDVIDYKAYLRKALALDKALGHQGTDGPHVATLNRVFIRDAKRKKRN